MSPKKYARMLRYNQIISRNRNILRAGYVMSRADFIAMFNLQQVPTRGTYEVIHSGNMKLMAVQSEINQLMRENGLKFSSKNYYSQFTVKSLPDTKLAADRLNKKIDRITDHIKRWDDAVVARKAIKRWGHPVAISPRTIAILDTIPATPRAIAMDNRVKAW